MPERRAQPLSRRRRAVRALVAFLVVFATASSLAHGLKLFALANGARIEGTVHFAGGGEAAGVRVTVKDASGAVLAKLAPAPDGSFAYQARGPVDHLIVARSRDGHRAEWWVAATELVPGFAGDETRGAVDAESVPVAARAASPKPAPLVEPALEAAIERAVARQVRPLREELASAREVFWLRDILGGIGYLVGLAGLGLWWRARRAGALR